MKLINEKTGKEVKVGDAVETFRGEPMVVCGWREPHKPGSTGRIRVTDPEVPEGEHFHGQEFFPGVCGCKFV